LRGSIVEKQRAVPVLTFDRYGTPKSAVVVNGENRRKVTSAAISLRRRRHLERVDHAGFAGAAYALTAAVCGAILTMQAQPTGGQRIARPPSVLSSPTRSNSVVTGEI
jgi:hypothetical protein